MHYFITSQRSIYAYNVYACRMQKIRIEQHSATGGAWFALWLFTIGYLHLAFWEGVFALLLWPYYLGIALSSMPR